MQIGIGIFLDNRVSSGGTGNPDPNNFLTTEAGDTIATESGDLLIL